MKTLSKSLSLLFLLSLMACIAEKHGKADLLFRDGPIYTVNEQQPMAEAVAVVGNKIAFVGSDADAKTWIGAKTEVIDLQGKMLSPGFIEGHGHIMKFGNYMLNLELLDVKSYDELLDKVKEAVAHAKPGEWILGRGWHQSKWDPAPEMIKGFPTHDRLSAISPDNPVFLKHASGHAALVNTKAMEVAGILPLSKKGRVNLNVQGGEVITDGQGNPTGIFNDNAMSLIEKYIPENTPEKDRKAFQLVVDACYRNGITSFTDANVDRKTLEMYQELRKSGDLGLRIYVFLSGYDKDLLQEWYKKGPLIDTDYWLTVRAIKLFCDGALGSRTALLLEDYTDRPGFTGIQVMPLEFIQETAKNGLTYGFQVCTHAIGDKANREVLDSYEMAFKENPQAAKNSRFRIEHAQHLSLQDIPRFARLGVIPAMQAIHLSSDRPWAIDRLGEKRIKEGAYVWQKLLKTGVRIVNGTDVPVEPINPIACFYASVTRKTLQGTPPGGYEPDQKMTRLQALQSYTINAAYGSFTEDVKGSIEVGKLADLTVFSRDMMKVDEDKLLGTRVVMTFLDGKKVYEKE